ncbi:unnamed protein product, partial [marine sediment metagenome]
IGLKYLNNIYLAFYEIIITCEIFTVGGAAPCGNNVICGLP